MVENIGGDEALAMLKKSILIYAGSIASIPSGWHLCDGAGGTIDLRSKMVIGAGSGYAVGDTGGSNTHTHPIGNLTSTDTAANVAGGFDWDVAQTGTVVTVADNTDVASNLPVYYALAFIQWVGT